MNPSANGIKYKKTTTLMTISEQRIIECMILPIFLAYVSTIKVNAIMAK